LGDLAIDPMAMVGKFGPNKVFIVAEEGVENAY
jgi:hypothetical protein